MDANGIIEVCLVFDLEYSRIYTPRKRGPHMQISCPLAWDRAYHSSKYDTRPSCSVTVNDDGPSKARCHSASCGFKGSFLDLIRKAVRIRRSKRANKELAELVKKIREAESVNLGNMLESTKRRAENAPTTLYAAQRRRGVHAIPEDRLERMESAYHPYAEKRGITEESWHRWGLRYDSRKGSLVFPVRAVGGSLVGMVGRAVRDDDPDGKKNYPGLDKSSHLYGEHLLIPERPIIIVEGPIDCVRSDAFLKDRAGVVATLGEGFSDDQSRLIRSMRPSVVYIFADGDRGGRVIASKIADALSRHVILRQMNTPKGEDPGSLSGEKIISLYERAARIKNIITAPS